MFRSQEKTLEVYSDGRGILWTRHKFGWKWWNKFLSTSYTSKLFHYKLFILNDSGKINWPSITNFPLQLYTKKSNRPSKWFNCWRSYIFIISITKFKSAKISLNIMLVKVNDNKTLAGFSLVLVRHNYLGSISIHCCHSGFCEALHYSLDRLLHNV